MTPQPFNVSRRSFLRTCVATAAASGLPLWFVERESAGATTRPRPLAPNDRPAVALVGCGGMGRGDAKNASRFGDIVALCDVDEKHVSQAAEQFSKDGKTPAKFNDFRKLMERDDVHVILTCTPDHWHTFVNLAATQAGKDVYGEKPLTLTVDEGKHLVKAVHKHKTVLQTGTQQRSDAQIPTGLRIGPQRTHRATEGGYMSGCRLVCAKDLSHRNPCPPELNWDFWLGQAPKVDYMPQRCHLYFRYWYDYSGGTMTDWGAHHNDIALWAIGLPGPVRVEAKALAEPIPGGYTAISDYEVKFTYANGVDSQRPHHQG